MCDICLSKNKTLTNRDAAKEAEHQILQLLSDQQPHHVTQLRKIPLPYEQIEEALERLLLEEDIYLEDSYLTIRS